ncbi:MAG: ATP-binding protein [Spiribacter salinus]|uniref:ATP-binding protein n=1 Tax=Spiribacter salinus TaxID=1335746 RepID=A0A540VSS7_9GAMM|nr:MAG: ATP-binding protein [Spiribacter salinus]
MKTWREIAVPHKDVLEGTFQQAEFAADISAVHAGKAPPEYQDAVAFFDRTFITEGMRLLLTQVASRLTGKGGDPVIQLQTAFGGGKTHTMLAVYHLAKRTCAIDDLAGLPSLIEQAGLMEVPQAKVAVLDGTSLGPNQVRKYGKQAVKTLWGELAWQLGGAEGFELVKDADTSGTSPGKEILRDLLARFAPCVVLIDELVAFIRQFNESQTLAGGTYDSNLSFVQSLTEAVKLVPDAVVLASLPESEVEAGSQRGIAALRALEKTFGRVQALWKPVATEEAFEIVRRRLFEPITDAAARDAVCRAFADLYVAEGSRLPGETQEGRYYDRLVQAYPVHPEVFDRLYEDWTTIDGFQRTRGVLKLMAKVIYRLWKDENADLMILPGSLPLADGSTRNELTYYLQAGWDPVIDKDIDGNRSETDELESKEPRFGQIGAARRVARTIFLGTAPSAVATKPGTRGLDRARVLLGCLQPGQSSATYADALSRLADRLHYLTSSGDKTSDATRFWFDTRANLRREMEDRKRRFDDNTDVRTRIGEALKRVVSTGGFFDGAHIFTPHGDVPDDSALRLVVLPPECFHSREDDSQTTHEVAEYLKHNGPKPRYRANRLLFLAADRSVLSRLRDAVRTALAWESIVEDIKDTRLVVDMLQKKQAEKELESAASVIPRVARECYKWLLCPFQARATDTMITTEAHSLNTGGGSLASEMERVCVENELVITTWSPIHLANRLKDLYWKPDQPAASAMQFWEDSLKYLYLPRLQRRDTLAGAIRTGATSRDFFACALGRDGEKYIGFTFGQPIIQFDDTLLLIEPEAALAYEEASRPAPVDPEEPATGDDSAPPEAGGATKPGSGRIPVAGGRVADGGTTPGTGGAQPPAAPTVKTFHGAADIPAGSAKARLVELSEEIIQVLSQDPNADIRITVEISANFPEGAPDTIRRAISENANQLEFKMKVWE